MIRLNFYHRTEIFLLHACISRKQRRMIAFEWVWSSLLTSSHLQSVAPDIRPEFTYSILRCLRTFHRLFPGCSH